jgi:hypothetical protein
MTLHFRRRPAAVLVCSQQHNHSLLTCEREYRTVTEATGDERTSEPTDSSPLAKK